MKKLMLIMLFGLTGCYNPNGFQRLSQAIDLNHGHPPVMTCETEYDGISGNSKTVCR